MSRKNRPRYKFRGLRALISALAEGALSREQVDQALEAVQMGIGLSKRDRALGEALEQTGDAKDSPAYWDGYRAGLVEGYEGARTDAANGVELRPIAEIAAEAQAEAQTAAGGKGPN